MFIYALVWFNRRLLVANDEGEAESVFNSELAKVGKSMIEELILCSYTTRVRKTAINHHTIIASFTLYTGSRNISVKDK